MAGEADLVLVHQRPQLFRSGIVEEQRGAVRLQDHGHRLHDHAQQRVEVQLGGHRRRHLQQPGELAGTLGHHAFQHAVAVLDEVAGVLVLEVGPDPRLDDGRGDRLRDVVDGADGEALGLVSHLAHRGHEDHGDAARGGVGLEPATDLVAVHPRHHHVQKHEVRLRLSRCPLESLLAVRGHEGPVVRLQQAHQQVDVHPLVVDDQDRGLCVAHGLP